MVKRKPAVAILVPTYNGARFLDETLRSIQEQSYANLRVIIRDDGSGDATRDIARSYAADDTRFTCIAGDERIGATGNCIELLKLADEEYVKIATQDDPLERRHIERLVTPMIKNPSITLASSARTLIDENGNRLPDQPFNAPLVDKDTTLEGPALARYVLINCVNQIGEPSTALIRNDSFDASSPFSYGGTMFDVNADVAMWLTLLSGGDLFYAAAPLSRFRQHAAQRSVDPDVHVRGVLEWHELLASGVREGLLPAGPVLAPAAARLIGFARQVSGTITAAGSADLRRYLDPLREAIERTQRLATEGALTSPR